MIMKMTQDLGNRMEKMQEMFTKDLEELKNKHTEMNNILEGINSRTTEAEAQINNLEDRMQNRIQKKEWREKKTA